MAKVTAHGFVIPSPPVPPVFRRLCGRRTVATVGVSLTSTFPALPAEGWFEHDAIEIWEAVRPPHRGSSPDPPTLPAFAALGIPHQRETVVRGTGSRTPLHRAIVWQYSYCGVGAPAHRRMPNFPLCAGPRSRARSVFLRARRSMAPPAYGFKGDDPDVARARSAVVG